jgi:hypothetical protein
MQPSRNFVQRSALPYGGGAGGGAGGGVGRRPALYLLRDPSPSHLRYPVDSYKTRTEQNVIGREPTRWDW